MAPPLTDSHKDRILHHILMGRINARIADIEGCHPSTVDKIRTNFQAYGMHTVPPEFKHKSGPARKIHPAALTGLIGFIETKPWLYLDEMQYYLFDDWGIFVYLGSVSMALEKAKISRKALKRVASERSQALRDTHKLAISKYSHEMIVALDDSAANEHTARRKRGWGPFGVSPQIKIPVKRSERHSILPAYTSSGLLTRMIYQGSINGPRFLWFLEQKVLPMCTPFPGPRSVLLMDNCSTHHVYDVERICAEAGVVVEYLPPYFPDFNPIEEFFSKLKCWMKRHFELAGQMPFQAFLNEAVEACGGEESARGYFEHAGIDCGGHNSSESEDDSSDEAEFWE